MRFFKCGKKRSHKVVHYSQASVDDLKRTASFLETSPEDIEEVMDNITNQEGLHPTDSCCTIM